MPKTGSDKAIVGYNTGEITAKGAVTIEIIIPQAPLHALLDAQYLDSKIMSRRPGMISKYLPYRYDEKSGKLLTGGAYLFDTWEDAKDYVRWTTDDFRVGDPQVKFWDQPMFESHRGWVWKVIGGHSFASMEDHAVGKLQQWQYRGEDVEATLSDVYSALRSAAKAQNASAIWLLHNPEEKAIGIQLAYGKVEGNDHIAAKRSLENVSGKPSLGHLLPKTLELSPLYERTSLHLILWLPKSRATGGTELHIPFYPVVPDITHDYV